MFLIFGLGVEFAYGFPRIRGDVPRLAPTVYKLEPFSPHTRGCSFLVDHATDIPEVFPAYAGMFPWGPGCSGLLLGFPRIRGDVPDMKNLPHVITWFSPHTRGCSVNAVAKNILSQVFPAYAGMFLPPAVYKSVEGGFPRIRGDVPMCRCSGQIPHRFSPHTRGCSQFCWHRTLRGRVFPAYAGMFPAKDNPRPVDRRFPRIRGDVPRGRNRPGGSVGFSRIRGDVPASSQASRAIKTFSPHTRGCSQQVVDGP